MLKVSVPVYKMAREFKRKGHEVLVFSFDNYFTSKNVFFNYLSIIRNLKYQIKEFNPSMVKAVFYHLDGECFHNFTVGITDDVTNKSIPVKEEIVTEPDDIVRCIFWGLGSDGTVGANKNSIKIIGDNTDMNAQGHFVYD